MGEPPRGALGLARATRLKTAGLGFANPQAVTSLSVSYRWISCNPRILLEFGCSTEAVVVFLAENPH